MKRKRFLFSKKTEKGKGPVAVGVSPNPLIYLNERACKDYEKMVLYNCSQETQRRLTFS